MPRLLQAALTGVCRTMTVFSAPASVAVIALGLCPAVTFAQQTSDRIRIVGDDAFHWTQTGTRTVLIEKNVQIITDDTTMTADRAVIWLNNDAGTGNYAVQIALMGNAKVVRGDVTREAPELLVNSQVKPDIKLEVNNLVQQDKGTDVHYLAAMLFRRQADNPRPGQPANVPETPANQPPAQVPGVGRPDTGADTRTPTATLPPATRPASTRPTDGASTRPVQLKSTVNFRSERAPMVSTQDGKIAMVLSGNVALLQTRPNGDRVELQADNVVVFTRWTDIRELFEGDQVREADAMQDIEAVYLEGDVRITTTPLASDRPEQSLRASRAVYEFDTERAILTDALLHMNDPRQEAPLVLRAQSMKKLGQDDYEANRASITTSSFARPSLSLAASKVTIREKPTGDKRDPYRTVFLADHVTPRLYGAPVFWFPRLWGTTTDGGSLPLRDIGFTNSTGFGFGIESKWGLFQTFGTEPPEGLDAQYRLDYYSERGPALGIDANYSGGYIDENTLQPWSYLGDFTAYGVIDDGIDKLGRRRSKPSFDNEFRGRVKWNHQQFLTDNWQLQARIGFVSDPTFLEEWFRNEFRNGLEQDASLYLKRSQGSEVFTGLMSFDLNQTPTAADQLQEVTGVGGAGSRYPVFVERLPEIQYHRIGESVFDDRMTWMSNNSVAGLHFNTSYANLSEVGLANPAATANNDSDVGIPTYAYTGVSNDYVIRGDTRQELAYPLGNDKFRLVPYSVVRYTAYSDSPDDSAQDRLLGGVGVRASTQFYKTYNGVHSDLLDIHRLRHVIEPQVHLFASAQTADRGEVYQYDEGVDGVSDIAAANFSIRQRFQTKRGAPGRERSVDFLTLNTGAVFFANEPEEIGNPASGANFDTADGFRGVFYNGMPEASIARSTAYADATWRVTDTTAILGDAAWNLQSNELATSAIGLAVQREPRTRYYAGVRYIGEVNSTIGTFTFDYDISERYSLAVNTSFNFNENSSQSTNVQLIRKFEQFVFTLTVYVDRIEDEGGITFSVSPRNMPFGGYGVGEGTGGRR